MTSPQAQPSKAQPSLGRYRLLATLGTGSTSHVYLARATGFSEAGKFFAVKVLRGNLALKPGEAETFLAEHRLAAMVKHKRVIGVFEVGSDRGRSYAALQYVRGEPLELVLTAAREEGRKLSFEAWAFLFAEIADGVHAGHSIGAVAHRALFAKNIILGFDGVPRLADCGISAIAPDIREDIFALGELMRAWAQGDLPPELEAIVAAALESDPADRFATAEQLAQVLRAFGEGRSSELDAAVEVRALMHELFGAKLEACLAAERRAMLEMRAVREASPLPVEIVVREAVALDPAERSGERVRAWAAVETEVIPRTHRRPPIRENDTVLIVAGGAITDPLEAIGSITGPISDTITAIVNGDRRRLVYIVAMAMFGLAALAVMAWSGL